MLTVSLRDKNVVENLKAINELKQFGFSEKEIQELYDRQLESDNPELLEQ